MTVGTLLELRPGLAAITALRASTVSELAALEAQWRETEAADPTSTVFSTWEWNEAAAMRLLAPSQDLWVTMFYEDDQPLGVAPLGLRPWHTLRTLAFIGTGLHDYSRADYQDLIAADCHRPTVVDQLCSQLGDERQAWDMLWLQELPPDSQTPRLLKAEAEKRGWLYEEAAASDVHWIDLPETWDAYRQGLSANTREAIERKLRKLMRETGATTRRVETRSDLPFALTALFDLHAKRWQAAGQRGIFASERSQTFHRELADSLFRSGMLDLTFFEVAGEPIGARYSFSHKGKHYFYANGYECEGDFAKYSLGLVMDGFAIRTALEAGFEREDFLRGEAQYKGRYGTGQRFNRQVRVFHSRRHYMRYRLISLTRDAAKLGRHGLRILTGRKAVHV